MSDQKTYKRPMVGTARCAVTARTAGGTIRGMSPTSHGFAAGRGADGGGSVTCEERRPYRFAALLLLALAILSLTPNARAQQLPPGAGANDFNSVEYYGAPHQQEIKRLFSGAEAQPLPGGLLLIKKVKIEMFDLNGKLQFVVEAPECIYDPVNVVANSSGEVHVRAGDGRLKLDGEGFSWRHNEGLFTISNQVQTVIETTPAVKR